MARSIDNHKRRHLCFYGEKLVVMSSSSVSSHGRRYVAYGRMPKCSFFEWIDDEEKWKNGLTKLFSPVVKTSSIRIVLGLAASLNLKVEQLHKPIRKRSWSLALLSLLTAPLFVGALLYCVAPPPLIAPL
ncbi:hypothetical protein PIB30_038593 [Stylosanthes scabra]|uniref:Zinc finger GRF-type domain-containing protein n=1 Tax=Stylosanthes scabra TaxID=79078 RepID=A0ABU6REL4_9FABA|nr:hypothetical protein [Stylosanthes scabra]